MKTYGDGGRIVPSAFYEYSVLNGVLIDVDDRPPPMEPVHCANPRCIPAEVDVQRIGNTDMYYCQHCDEWVYGRLFRPRAVGDIYHSEACDLDANPQFKGSKKKDTGEDDPSWEDARKRTER